MREKRLHIFALRLALLFSALAAWIGALAHGADMDFLAGALTPLGRMMTVVSRLGSRPHRLLESAEASPGEIRKILLAIGIARMPHLIVMDEPTNHLDLPSIECLEEALAECPCGLWLVSHDERFLERLTRTRWRIGDHAELEVVGG